MASATNPSRRRRRASFATQFALVLLGVGAATAAVAGVVAWVETQNGHDQEVLAAGAGAARLADSLLRLPTSTASQQLACEVSQLSSVVQGYHLGAPALSAEATQAVQTAATGQTLVFLGPSGGLLAGAPANRADQQLATQVGAAGTPAQSCSSAPGSFIASGGRLFGAGLASVTEGGKTLGRVAVLTPVGTSALHFTSVLTRALGPASQAFIEISGRLALPARVGGVTYRQGSRLPPGLQPGASQRRVVTSLSGAGSAVTARPLQAADGTPVATLVVTQSMLSAQPTAQELAVPLVLAVAAVLLVGMLVAFLLAERFLNRPLRRLDQAVQQLGQDAYAEPIRIDGAEEITRLAANFEIMRRHLRRQMLIATGRTVIANTLTANSSLELTLAQVLQSLTLVVEADAALVAVRAFPPMSEGLLLCHGLRGPALTPELYGGSGILGDLLRTPRFAVRDLLSAAERGPDEQALGVRSLLAEPLKDGDHELGVLLVLNKSQPYTEEDSTLCAAVAEQLVTAVEKSLRLQETQREATTDAMTGLYNYRFLASYLDQQVNVADRASTRLSVLMLDLDHFKAVNDSHGHSGGDRVLRAFASTLVETIRKSDLAARYGGEEFVVVMANTGREEAEVVAEKIRLAVDNMVVDLEGGAQTKLTVSVGGVTFPDGSRGARNLLDLSDRALYAAKHGGRNRVEFFDPPAPAGGGGSGS